MRLTSEGGWMSLTVSWTLSSTQEQNDEEKKKEEEDKQENKDVGKKGRRRIRD